MADRPVYLDGTEARLVVLAIEALNRVGDRLISRLGLTAEYGALRAKCLGSVRGTLLGAPQPAGPPSLADLCTVQQAAAIWRCSPRAVVKAIGAGRLRAWRPGREWLLDVREVRRMAGRGRRHGSITGYSDALAAGRCAKGQPGR